jgi:hypothetical protein
MKLNLHTALFGSRLAVLYPLRPPLLLLHVRPLHIGLHLQRKVATLLGRHGLRLQGLGLQPDLSATSKGRTIILKLEAAWHENIIREANIHSTYSCSGQPRYIIMEANIAHIVVAVNFLI